MAALTLTAAEIAELRARHAAVLHRPVASRLIAPFAVACTLVYLVFCFFFFNVPGVIADAKWDRAETYVADWYSWEALPRFRFRGEAVELEWTRSLLGDKPDPDWIEEVGPSRYVVRFDRPEDRVEIAPGSVVAYVDGVAYPVPLTAEGAVLPANAPASMTLKSGRVTIDYGFVGSAEIRNTQVYVRHRFWGWPNFLFDTKSPFFGMTPEQLWNSATSSERVDPRMPNWQLMLVEFGYNSEWQHLDVYNKLLQTIVMAFVGTLFATIVAFPLSFIAARNITRSRTANWLMKRAFDFLRSVDMLIWALFFVRGFGPGPIPGIAAIFFTDTGTLGKTNTEALENIDDRQREGVKSVGASGLNVQRYGVVPQVLPVFISQSLYFWESNTRSATVIGAVGAGGIGLKLIEAMRTNQDWENVAYMVLLILIVVFVFDNISNALRSRLIGPRGH
ncbi:MAG TPA: phosphonate ABC transporter, permease protein PhnE [Devosia sp.]|jgi:phosphonate transport system permease protein|uniref:phosphonate ABC transporter, permease protein PhnE n=1 Tax=Devosia sp. TaxID=1871048 RepID=UPI002DDCE719|nr:phosphonate ABC transporter, permease protein PhnE [Devosia sp.]HEV2518884.1 phosphonate ABC transporter, permease protein PhnE [Devosia sp.]